MRLLGRRTAALSLTSVLALPFLLGAAAPSGYSSEVIESEGVRVVSTTHENFASMLPGGSVSWFLEVSAETDPAELDLELIASGDMPLSASVSECSFPRGCQRILAETTLVSDEPLGLGSFEDTVELRIDFTASEELTQQDSMTMSVAVTGTEGSLHVSPPPQSPEQPVDGDEPVTSDRSETLTGGDSGSGGGTSEQSADEQTQGSHYSFGSAEHGDSGRYGILARTGTSIMALLVVGLGLAVVGTVILSRRELEKLDI